MSSPTDKLKEVLEDPDFAKKFWEDYERKEQIAQKQINKVRDYILDLSIDEFHSQFADFLKREEELEERYYQKSILTSSRVFNAICGMVQEEGHDVFEQIEDPMFLSGAWEWRGYRFSLYCGQGCFWRIEQYQDQVLTQIFQTT